ncbi:diguanylate cyclase/phosphodiesterase [Sphaerotilus hippei]|uniref:Diguanylate cyclase/phosphodiesterase n=1 Tax=Sphaerotilus hippei TaxID=744406 RepID=A0A318GZQ8_9BURK|nr:EAL domain-containing protein [Sphaerotilus hippei]PXW95825.1 diguanylate cyclase/phosphodiesterase [Sphaerotilus hippei]
MKPNGRTDALRLSGRWFRWRLSGLERRIVWPFLLLLVLVQGMSLWLVHCSIERSASRTVEAELHTGLRVFNQLLLQRAERLSEAAALLASDEGFQWAASRQEVTTLADALDRHGQRIGASLVIYTDTAWTPLAAAGLSVARVVALLPAAHLAAMAPAAVAGMTGPAVLTLIEGQPYQIVAVPVKAPSTIGWVLMGFVLDEAVLKPLADITDLRAAVLLGSSPQQVLAATRAPGPLPPMEADVTDPAAAPDPTLEACGQAFREAGQRWRNCRFTLDTVGSAATPEAVRLQLVLARSVDPVIAPFQRLQLTLLLLTLGGALVFAVGSVVTARRLSTPLRGLRLSAERLRLGDYDSPVPIPDRRRAGRELAQLAQSFESMRLAVQRREREIRRLAYWDTLTGLPNRAQFVDALRSVLQGRSASPARLPVAVLMLDLDRFKHVNDVLGHELGDRLLCEVARRLSRQGRPDGVLLARLSGDEFALLLSNADREPALQFARALLQCLDEPLRLDEHTVDLSASLGIVLAPGQGDDPEALLSLVEVAMYAAKRRQLGVVLYEPSMDHRSEASLSLMSELRRAIEQQELRLYVQPKVDLLTGEVLGGEALVRWQHPQRGLVQPMQFIPFAEQTGFIRQITIWMLEAGIREMRRWQDQGHAHKLSINLSTRDLLDPDLPARVSLLLERHQVPATRLCLEITESTIMDDPQRALQTLQKLHDLGLRLSIDDFGTGYSSLAYLKRLPVDELKIDRSFVMNMERDLDDARIVQSTIGLAHHLGLSVVAEGIETDKAWALLARLGCDEGQGYGIGRPMPADQWLAWVATWQAPATEAVHLDTDFTRLL